MSKRNLNLFNPYVSNYVSPPATGNLTLPERVSAISAVNPELKVMNNHMIYNEQGKAAVLGKEISQGGQGIVYHLEGNEKTVVKIYTGESFKRQKTEIEQKLKAAVEIRKQNKPEGAAWPGFLVYNDKQEFIGYAMAKAEGVKLKYLAHAMLYKKYFPKLTRMDIVEMLLTLAENILKLHKQKILVGDMNLDNILVNQLNYTPTLIDCDSYQLDWNGKQWYCPVGRPEQLPPELQGVNLSRTKRTFESEMFCLMILVFQCLMIGRHPYDSLGGGAPHENIIKGYFPYGSRDISDGIRGIIPKGPWYIIWSHLPYDLKSMFIKTFTEGSTDPGQRPLMKELIDVLKKYRHMLHKGHANNEIVPDHVKKSKYIK